MRMKSKLMVGVSALGLAAGGGGAALATSQQGADTSQPSQEAFLQDAAKRLGVSETALADALKGAASDQVDAALAAGKITKDEADAIKARIQAGDGPLFGLGFGRHVEIGADGLFEAAAAYLGLSPDTLRSDLENGKTLADLAQAAGKSVDGLKSAMLADVKKHLDEEVGAGRLTASQEQDMLDHITADLDGIVNGTGPAGKPKLGFGFGFGAHHRSFGP